MMTNVASRKHLLPKYLILFLVLFTSRANSQVNQLWGLTSAGGANSNGVLFSYLVSTNTFTNRKDLVTGTGTNPYGAVVLFNNKLYGTTRQGGVNGFAPYDGTLFEWDGELSKYADKKDLNSGNILPLSTGYYPTGSLTAFGTKLYGTTTVGGQSYSNGVIFEWDPATNVYAIRREFTGTSGAVLGKNPLGSLVLYNNKFYGMTRVGGVNSLGVIFAWDPVTNNYNKLYDFTAATGSSPQGSLVVYNGKLYGMTQQGGLGSAPGSGVIFQFDPSTNTYIKEIDLSTISGESPYGDLVFYNNKMYGVTTQGGANTQGIIFEWDPNTNVCIDKYDMTIAGGANPNGTLSLFNSKMYGMTNLGGAAGFGVIFEWDPLTNAYVKKFDFTGITNGANPERGALVVIPAPVAPGTANVCETAPTVTIDASNTNSWVPIVDIKGDVIAEIKGNGNLLGTVSTTFYTQFTPHREDINHKLYLGRNIHFTPQLTTATVTKDSIRIYIKKYEVDSLQNALNSQGQPTGVASINELGVFKNNEPCQTVGIISAKHVTTTSRPIYGVDYYIQFPDTTVTTYYFANDTNAFILPIRLDYFKGFHNTSSNILRWKVTCNSNISLDVERSADGRNFERISTIPADTSNCGNELNFIDYNPLPDNNYYRLRIIENNSFVKYSDVILLQGNHSDLTISLVPTIISGTSANVRIISRQAGVVELVITDLQGRTMLRQQLNISAGSNFVVVNVQNLSSGIYQLYGISKNLRTTVQRFVKE